MDRLSALHNRSYRIQIGGYYQNIESSLGGNSANFKRKLSYSLVGSVVRLASGAAKN